MTARMRLRSRRAPTSWATQPRRKSTKRGRDWHGERATPDARKVRSDTPRFVSR